jgi:predicted dehydrogenase
MFAIIGSGFGLYGYLPAIAEEGENIALPERYRARFESRAELAPFAAVVRWFADETAALAHADAAVVAVRPADQPGWVARCLAQPNIRKLILEKPLAPTPAAAASLLTRLMQEGKQLAIGYTFSHTAWARALRDRVGGGGSVRFIWHFLAPHYRNDLHNWKRSVSQGGGAIRFYGIQVIALLAELGYVQVIHSLAAGRDPDDIELWTAAFAAPRLGRFEISLDARSSTTRFMIENERDSNPAEVWFDADDPFAGRPTRQGPGLDRRVPILRDVFRSLADDSRQRNATYAAGLELWREVENKTLFSSAGPLMPQAFRKQ